MTMFIVYVIAALAPAAALLLYIYKKDRVEQEPPALLWKLVGFGALSALAAMVLENLFDPVIMAAHDPQRDFFGYTVISAFLGVGLVEEGAKYFFLRIGSWKEPNFNFRFDGIVYAVSVSLGFAALENLGYVFGYGLSVAPARALLSIPGHMSFAVVMGYFYSRARLLENYGERSMSLLFRVLGVVMATLMHGFYDCCLMLETGMSTVVFVLFVAALFFVIFRLVRREARADEPIL